MAGSGPDVRESGLARRTSRPLLRQTPPPLLLCLLACAWPLACPATGSAGSLILSCPVCHGASDTRSAMPGPQGLDAAQIERRLLDYRSGALAGTAMPRLMAPLTEDEIRAIALHYGATAR